MHSAPALAFALLLAMTAHSLSEWTKLSAQQHEAPEDAAPRESGSGMPQASTPSAPSPHRLAEPLPPTSEETIDLLRLIAAEQARTREAMSAFDFQAREHRRRHEGRPGDGRFELDRVVTVTRAGGDQLFINEEQKDALIHKPKGNGGLTPANSGRPLVSRYLQLPDLCVMWYNVLQRQLEFQDKVDWPDWHQYSRCGAVLQSIDLAQLSTRVMGTRGLDELVARLSGEGDADWRWEVIRESETWYRLNQWSRWEPNYLLNTSMVDMSRGAVVTEATFTPRRGSGGMPQKVHNTYVLIDGVQMLQQYDFHMQDEEGRPLEVVTITYSNYRRSDPDRVFSLEQLLTPEDAFFSRVLPDIHANGGAFKLEGGKLIPTELDENRRPK